MGINGQQGGIPLQLDVLSYRYPGTTAGVCDVSLLAEPGAIYGLLGQNGAGKTTLMRLMLGLLVPDAGRVLLGGWPLGDDRARQMASIGSLIETPSLYLHLTGREHLCVFSAYYRLPAGAADAALDRVGLGKAGDTIVRRYSLGMKQRLGLATALLHDPAVLVLDEPTNGLDPGGIAELRGLLGTLAAEGKTIIVSSHLLAEVEKTASRIGILHQGRLRFEGSMADFAARAQSHAGAIFKVSDTAKAMPLLAAVGVTCRPEEGRLHIDDVDEVRTGDIVRHLVIAGIDIFEVRPLRPSLEQDFLRFVESDADAR